MTERWERNFGPDSTSEKIVGKLLEEPNVDQLDRNELKKWLEDFRAESDLGRIDLLQLRDYLEFQCNLVKGHEMEKQYQKLSLTTWELMEQEGVLL